MAAEGEIDDDDLIAHPNQHMGRRKVKAKRGAGKRAGGGRVISARRPAAKHGAARPASTEYRAHSAPRAAGNASTANSAVPSPSQPAPDYGLGGDHLSKLGIVKVHDKKGNDRLVDMDASHPHLVGGKDGSGGFYAPHLPYRHAPDGRSVRAKKPARPNFWTKGEDAMLRAAVKQHGAKSWKLISSIIPGRTHVQCLQRWEKVLRPGLRKGAWLVEEDELLCQLVAAGHSNWGQVARHIPGRSAKQCRERWNNNLDPRINRGPWTPEEDAILLKVQREQGNRWAALARMLPGRTENAIKTRFKSIMRARKRQWTAEEDMAIIDACNKHGGRWEMIMKAAPQRTKNAIKTYVCLLVAIASCVCAFLCVGPFIRASIVDNVTQAI